MPDYRKTFDLQLTNPPTTEMKNNAARLAKYTITVSNSLALLIPTATDSAVRSLVGKLAAVCESPTTVPPLLLLCVCVVVALMTQPSRCLISDVIQLIVADQQRITLSPHHSLSQTHTHKHTNREERTRRRGDYVERQRTINVAHSLCLVPIPLLCPFL